MKETQVIKFTEDEMKQINEFKTKFSEITAQLGELEIETILVESQLESLKKYKDNLKNDYIKLRESEVKLAGTLKEKYGEGELDVNTGVFKPSK
jgi:DNA repair exonuclease SbcCD ATPase subunit